MFTLLQRLLKYSKYWLTAANGKGHGIHSPFVFKFVIDILNDDRFFYAFGTIESIVNADLNNKKFNRLLFKMVNYYQSRNILLVDETIGITTSYVALANTDAAVYSYFSEVRSFNKAKEITNQFNIQNCQFTNEVLDVKQQFDLVYINALNKAQLSDALVLVLPKLHTQSILIIKNIYSSQQLESEWSQLQTNSAVTLTINLFQIGLVFFRPENKMAQHFTIRF